jgi:hypothetical protein
MFAILHALGMLVVDLFKSLSRACTENLTPDIVVMKPTKNRV